MMRFADSSCYCLTRSQGCCLLVDPRNGAGEECEPCSRRWEFKWSSWLQVVAPTNGSRVSHYQDRKREKVATGNYETKCRTIFRTEWPSDMEKTGRNSKHIQVPKTTTPCRWMINGPSVRQSSAIPVERLTLFRCVFLFFDEGRYL